MILYNVAQARSNTLAHNDKLRKTIDVIIGAVVSSVEEGKFKTSKLSFPTDEQEDNEANEAFVKGYFESLGYRCSVENCRSKERVFFEVSWY